MKLFTLIATLLLLQNPAFAGREGNGGDDVALEFLDAFQTSYTVIKNAVPVLYKEIKDRHLDEVAKKATVVVVETPLYVEKDGYEQESVAKNDPKTGLVLINRARWQKIANVHIREAIALHEISGLAGLETTGTYSASYNYISVFGLTYDDLDKLAYYPPPPNKVGDLQCGGNYSNMNLTSESSYFLMDAACDVAGRANLTGRCASERQFLLANGAQALTLALNAAFKRSGKKIPPVRAKDLQIPKKDRIGDCADGTGSLNGVPTNAYCLIDTVTNAYERRICQSKK